MKDKKRFVEIYLTPVLQAATDGNVCYLAYAHLTIQSGEKRELVAIHTQEDGTLIDVTGHDRLTIIRDVLDALPPGVRERERESRSPGSSRLKGGSSE